MDGVSRTHAETDELWSGTRSIIKVDVAFMRAVQANPAMRDKDFLENVGIAEREEKKYITNKL